MSTIELSTFKTFETFNFKTVSLSAVTVNKVVDVPGDNLVFVWANTGTLRIKVNALSDGNYNNPPWNDENLIAALSAQIY